MRPWVLDLCCGGGGFSAGIYAAGFNVLGVDLHPQPHYPFPFVQADALDVDLSGCAAIVASPPCQRWSQMTPPSRRDSHPDVLTPLRERLIASGVPWVIENVPGAPLRDPVQLCGVTLRLGVRRHRLFESNVPLVGTPCVHDSVTPAVGVYGTHGGADGTVDVATAREAMGAPWLPWDELAQSIPPMYGLWIGSQLWRYVRRDGSDLFANVTAGPADQTPPAAMRHAEFRGDASPAVGVTDEPRVQASRRRRLSSARQSDVPPPLCRHCATHPVSRPSTGRWGIYCSHACRQAAYRVRVAQAQ